MENILFEQFIDKFQAIGLLEINTLIVIIVVDFFFRLRMYSQRYSYLVCFYNNDLLRCFVSPASNSITRRIVI